MTRTVIISLIFALTNSWVYAQKTISTSDYIRKGDLGELVYFHDSLFTGTAIQKAKNGQITAEEHYLNGAAHGLWKQWYKTGEKKFEGGFADGKNDGVWIEWNEDGTVKRKMVFDKGKVVEAD